jgi:hypothetical protein
LKEALGVIPHNTERLVVGSSGLEVGSGGVDDVEDKVEGER